jgi:hypothetical protein
MEVTFSLDREDYWLFNKYLALHSAQLRFRYLCSAALAFTFPLLGALAPWTVLAPNRTVTPALVVGSVGGVVCVIASYWYTKRKVMQIPSAQNGFLGQHRLSIAPEGLRDATPVGEGIRRWAGISDISHDGQYIHMLIDTVSGWAIPKRAFPSEQAAQDFLNAAITYWKAETGTASGAAGEPGR